MTPNEIQMLLVGIAFGAQGMNAFHVFLDARLARRNERASRQARRIAMADSYFSSFRIYRIQHRSSA